MVPTTASDLGPNEKKNNNNNNKNSNTLINIVLTAEKEKIHKVKIAVLFIK